MVIAFVLGACAAIIGLLAWCQIVWWRVLVNRSPDWTQPGMIAKGSIARFEEAVSHVFPDAPARSYVALSAFRDVVTDEDTVFFIRSVGKRGGQHAFCGELRFGVRDRDHLVDALPMFEGIAGPVERVDKTYGAVVLTTPKSHDLAALLDFAHAFGERALGAAEGEPIKIKWHIAGANASDRRN